MAVNVLKERSTGVKTANLVRSVGSVKTYPGTI